MKHIIPLNEDDHNQGPAYLMRRIEDLKNEYKELNIAWLKNKDFKKLDRAKEIELVFKNMRPDSQFHNYGLPHWKNK